MRIWLKRIGLVCLIPVALILLLSVLLYIPPFQNFIIKQATRYASEATGMQIKIERIHLSFPLDLTIRGVQVIKAPADTVLTLRDLTVSIHPLPLLQQQVLVDAIHLQGVKVNTGKLIDGMEIKGMLGNLYAKADRIDLLGQHAVLNAMELTDTAITLLLNDTTQKDTTSTPLNWKIKLDKIDLARVSFALQMPADSLRLSTYVDKAALQKGNVDLAAERYAAESFTISGSTFNFDTNSNPPTDGMDFSHISLDKLQASLTAVLYSGKKMNARIDTLSVEERSGLHIISLLGELQSDDKTILVPALSLKTPYSDVSLKATIPWSTLSNQPKGSMQVAINASLGKQDLLMIAGALPSDFKEAYPDKPFTVTATADGNLSSIHLREAKGELPGALRIDLSGDMEAVTDSIRRSGELRLKAETGKLDFVLAMLPVAQRKFYQLPQGMRLNGTATLANRAYRADMQLTEAKGKIDLSARYNPILLTYEAQLKVDSLVPTHFMPQDSLFWLTASIKASGKGTDPFSAATWAKVEGKISDIRYGATSVSDVTLSGSLEKNLAKVDLLSKYPLAKMDVTLNATLHQNDVKGMLVADVDHIDLYGLHLVEKPVSSSFQLFAEAESNLKENNRLDVTLGNWTLATPKDTVHPKTLTLLARSDQDTTRISFHAGDLGITLTGNAGLNAMTDKLTLVSKDMKLQLERDSAINLDRLRPLLPDMHLEVNAGRDNPIYNYLQTYYIDFKQFALNAYTSPESGLRMDASLYDLARDTLLIDTIHTTLWQDTLGLLYKAEVIKKKYRKQEPFSASLSGQLRYNFADARLLYTDGQGKTGISIGVRADKVPGGVNLHLFPEDPIIAFRSFKLNRDNYILYKGIKDISANLRLTGDDNASLWIHSTGEAEKTLQDIHAELSQIDLSVFSNAFTYLPAMRGILSADLQYEPSDSAFMVVADLNVDDLYYENDRVGELMFNAVYLPLEQGNHQVDMHLFRDQSEVVAATAFYRMGERDSVAGNIAFENLPLEMVSPFIPDDMARFSGALQGNLSINGTSAAPKVEGFLQFDTAAVFVGAVGSSFRFDNKKIEVKDNRISFNQFDIYASGKNPFVIDGDIDFRHLTRMTANLKLTANNMQLLDVKRNNESLVYGKMFVNMNATAKGPLDALLMRGNLQLLGGTNVTYVLKDSPLTVQDRLSGLVTFTSFTDTIRNRRQQEPPMPLGGMDMLMTIRIDQAVQLNADLSPDQSSHISLEGGGDLSFQYTTLGEMILNGRYTLSGGTVKYALPVIPLKEFNVQEGSYVQWTGNPMDPTLNLTATERMRASVSLDNTPSMVSFDVGIVLKQQLENLSLQFTLSAPENTSMQNQLNALSEEQRAKQAVTMMVTGMYIAEGGSTGKVNVNMGSALNSFLQSEINNIAGSALKSVDITFGMESYDENGSNGEGGNRTDYSFRFAKRFYNDRIRVVLGGRISTGENVNSGQGQAFIDNVSVEYRLDASGTRYVKLFHDKNYESLLEGEVTETGAGIVLRKKMLHLRELFIFKKNKPKPVKEEEVKK